jgi:hypothetical protein
LQNPYKGFEQEEWRLSSRDEADDGEKKRENAEQEVRQVMISRNYTDQVIMNVSWKDVYQNTMNARIGVGFGGVCMG